MKNTLTAIELCAGVGGQAIGLERAGFSHEAVVEIDDHCKQTLKLNRPHWNVVEGDQSDLNNFDASSYRGVDLVAAGLPCPPFSKAGKQLGKDDERNLFEPTLRIIDESRPKAVMIENVRGFLDAVFSDYRTLLKEQLKKLGYFASWDIFNASDFGVPQLRPRVVIVAVRSEFKEHFSWPSTRTNSPPTVGEVLYERMASRGWRGADQWRLQADDIAPTIVGGSKKHGGSDLGPTRAKKAWATLGVDGKGIADEPPPPDFIGMPRLTVDMVARLQDLPADWLISGRKTAAYRQVGNAFPPAVATAVGTKLAEAITSNRGLKVVA